MVIRAELFPPRTRRRRFSRSSGVSRTVYFSLTITATPILSADDAVGHRAGDALFPAILEGASMSLSVARERWAMAWRDCLNVSSLKVWFVAA